MQGKSDPYVNVHIVDECGELVGMYQKTSVKQDDLNPEWNEVFMFEGILDPLKCMLKLHVYDEDKILWSAQLAADDDLGKVTYPLNELRQTIEFQDVQLEITDGKFRGATIELGFNTLSEWGVSNGMVVYYYGYDVLIYCA